MARVWRIPPTITGVKAAIFSRFAWPSEKFGLSLHYLKGTTVRDGVLKPAFISSNFAVKIGLWTKWNFTGRFFNPSRPYAREANNHVRFLPTVGITELSKIKCVRY